MKIEKEDMLTGLFLRINKRRMKKKLRSMYVLSNLKVLKVLVHRIKDSHGIDYQWENSLTLFEAVLDYPLKSVRNQVLNWSFFFFESNNYNISGIAILLHMEALSFGKHYIQIAVNLNRDNSLPKTIPFYLSALDTKPLENAIIPVQQFWPHAWKASFPYRKLLSHSSRR